VSLLQDTGLPGCSMHASQLHWCICAAQRADGWLEVRRRQLCWLPCRNLGCLDPACTLCLQNPLRRCNDSCFAPKYLAGDILKAKCGASIRVEVISRTTGSAAPQALTGDVLLEARSPAPDWRGPVRCKHQAGHSSGSGGPRAGRELQRRLRGAAIAERACAPRGAVLRAVYRFRA